MPNHVTNKLVITGAKEAIDAFEQAFITPQPSDITSCAWSFEHFLPMPKILRRVIEDGKNPLMVREVSDTRYISAGRPATPEEIAEITATGSTGWYDWSLSNWGTKWDAYSENWERESDTEAHLKFDTAWSAPEPVFSAMAKHDLVKPLYITVASFDEGWNFALTGTIEDGEYIGKACDATAELYERVYGYPPERDEDTDEDTEDGE